MTTVTRDARRRWSTTVYTTLAVVACAAVVFPVYWMLSISLRDTVYLYPVRILPSDWGFDSYRTLFTEFPFTRWLGNTLYVAVGSTVVNMLLAIPAAYGLSRFKMRGRGVFDLTILASQMLPVSLLIVPFYVIWQRIGLLESLNGLMLANMAIALPIAIWMLRGFFDSVPIEVEEAARVDGCNRVQAIIRVTLRMALPGVLATGAFCFVEAWTEYLFAVTLITSSDSSIVSGGLAREMFEQSQIRWNVLMAGSMIATLPMFLLLVPLQRQLVRGITAGAVKS